MKRFLVLSLFLVLATILAACSLTPSGARSEPVEVVGPVAIITGDDVVEVAPAVPQEAELLPLTVDLRPLTVEHVGIEVGVGSPIPVDIFVSGTWPDLCAQLAQIDQKIDGFHIEVTLMTTAAQPDCPPDFLGLPFRIAIPLNVVEMPEGAYTVTVNGVETAFSLPESLATTSEPATADPAGDEPPVSAIGLCPEVPRPAVLLSLPGEGNLITNPISGESCTTSLGEGLVGPFQAAGDDLYFTVTDGEQLALKRLAKDGSQELLSFTAVHQDDALLGHSFAVSADGSRVAWAATSAGPDFSGQPESNMWVSDSDGSNVVMPLPPLLSESEGMRQALTPVRFSADNSTLYYTLQPVGLGGAWSSFVGRYDNLYALRLNTDADPALIYDCQNDHIVLCIGDFYEVENQVANLAYVDGLNVAILNGFGETVNTISLNHDYVGYPTFGPGGELTFYGADLSDSPEASLQPELGAIYRLAPPTAPHELLASAPELSIPQSWLDDTHVVVSYYHDDGAYWGVAVVGLDGSLQVLQSEPGASFVDVLPLN